MCCLCHGVDALNDRCCQHANTRVTAFLAFPTCLSYNTRGNSRATKGCIMNATPSRRSIPYLRVALLLAALTLLVYGVFAGDATLIRIESATL